MSKHLPQWNAAKPDSALVNRVWTPRRRKRRWKAQPLPLNYCTAERLRDALDMGEGANDDNRREA